MSNPFPLVSVVIPCKNSAKTIQACLVSVKNQTYPNVQIIVVDNFSTDDTFAIAQQYANQTYQVGPERTAQKNYGITQSHGVYVCFIDSDMVLDERVLQNCVQKMSADETIGGICIPEKSVGKGWFVALRDFERSFYAGSGIESARFFKKEDVEQVGWFEEDLIFFEESLLPQKIESKPHHNCHVSVDSFIYHQEWNLSLFAWLKKKFYYGQSFSKYRQKVLQIGIQTVQQQQTGIVWRYAIFFKNKRFYSKPLLAIGVLALKTLEFWAGGLWFLFSKI